MKRLRKDEDSDRFRGKGELREKKRKSSREHFATSGRLHGLQLREDSDSFRGTVELREKKEKKQLTTGKAARLSCREHSSTRWRSTLSRFIWESNCSSKKQKDCSSKKRARVRREIEKRARTRESLGDPFYLLTKNFKKRIR